MFLIPFQISKDSYNIFAVLCDDNIERIHGYDPAQIDIAKMGPEWSRLRLNVVLIGYATPDDVTQMTEMIQAGRAPEALKYLSRGFAFRPDKGDHDQVYKSAIGEQTNG